MKINPQKILTSPYLFLFVATLLVVLISGWLFFSKTEKLPLLMAKPEKPEITAIAPLSTASLSSEVPIVKFEDNIFPDEWLYKGKVGRGFGQKLVNSLKKNPENQSQLKKLKPFFSYDLIDSAWPDFTEAIDLNPFFKHGSKISSLLRNSAVFYTVIAFEQPQLLRTADGVAGFHVNAKIWLNGNLLKDGQLIGVEKGLYPLVVETYIDRKSTTKDEAGGVRRLATRFTTVTEEEIETVYQWQLAQWEKTVNATPENDAKLLSLVKFDPTTIRGKEGFFRVGKSVKGKWWFIDPDGKAFYHKGVTGLNAGGMGGRRANLPPVTEETAKQWVNYLQEWGFNAMGAWTTPEFFNLGMPFTEIIETYYEEPWLLTKFPDVWDKRWADNLDTKCKKMCEPLKNNKMLLGYFLDNERGFMEVLGHNETIVANTPTYQSKTTDRNLESSIAGAANLANVEGIGLLQFSLSLPENIPASQKAWEFVLERYKTLENLGKAWQIEVKSKDTFRDLTNNAEVLISPVYLQDLADFIKLWAEQYYQVIREKITKYDPNHLLLGSRWGGIPGAVVLDVEKEQADVVSFNTYRVNFYERFDDLYQRVQRPILNGEIHGYSKYFLFTRLPIEPPGSYTSETRRAINAEQAFDRVFSHPGVLGYSRYRWHGEHIMLWDEGPQYKIINPLREYNSRAVTIATEWDQPPAKVQPPIHGQIFLTLQEGRMSFQKLPTPTNTNREKTSGKIEPNLRITTEEIVIGLVCNQGVWDKNVYGDGIQGEIIESKTEGSNIQLKLKITESDRKQGKTIATGEYIINLQQNKTKLEGTHQGEYNGNLVEGKAIGYIYRPIPTIKY